MQRCFFVVASVALCFGPGRSDLLACSARRPKSLEARGPCLTSPLAILGHARERASLVEAKDPDLPLGLEAAYFMLAISLAQCESGVQGAVGELGSVLMGGALSFTELSNLRRAGDTLFMNGPFAGDDENGFDWPVSDFDATAGTCLGGPCVPPLQRFTANPLTLTDAQLLSHSGDGAGFRVLRVDRTRDANETDRLLSTAACSLVDGGLLLFEGIQGILQRPAAQEGFHRFMLRSRALPPERRLVPFLWAGKRGGLFLSHEPQAESYRQTIESLLLSRKAYGRYDAKIMYGSEVLASWWRADVASFEALLGLRGG